MDRYLLKLIERMCNKDKIPPFGSSADTISFKAYREAEKLEKQAYLPQLKTLAEENSDKNKKSYRDEPVR